MKFFKAIVVVVFVTFLTLGYYDFDVYAMWESAADSPFLFALGVIMTGLLGFVAVNKFNSADY